MQNPVLMPRLFTSSAADALRHGTSMPYQVSELGACTTGKRIRRISPEQKPNGDRKCRVRWRNCIHRHSGAWRTERHTV